MKKFVFLPLTIAIIGEAPRIDAADRLLIRVTAQ